jgi:hypothetical protein
MLIRGGCWVGMGREFSLLEDVAAPDFTHSSGRIRIHLMDDLFEVLESLGVVSESDVERAENLSNNEFIHLYEAVHSKVISTQYANSTFNGSANMDFDPFSYMASASMRGDAGCSEHQCRAKKLDFLGQFAALYANNVTLPLSLMSLEDVSGLDNARRDLSHSLDSLFALRPLIQNGIIRPVIMRTRHCEHADEFVNAGIYS